LIELPPKQEAFCQNIYKGLTQAKAYLKAGYKVKNENTAHNLAWRLQQKGTIKKRLDELRAEKQIEYKDEFGRFKKELEKLAYSDIGKFVKISSDGIQVEDITEKKIDTSCLSETSEYRTKKGAHTKIKMHSKEKALELLGRTMGAFTDKVEHSGAIEHRVVEYHVPNNDRNKED